jgi:hypothetical protein
LPSKSPSVVPHFLQWKIKLQALEQQKVRQGKKSLTRKPGTSILCWIDAVGYQITLVIEEKIEAIEDPLFSR